MELRLLVCCCCFVGILIFKLRYTCFWLVYIQTWCIILFIILSNKIYFVKIKSTERVYKKSSLILWVWALEYPWQYIMIKLDKDYSGIFAFKVTYCKWFSFFAHITFLTFQILYRETMVFMANFTVAGVELGTSWQWYFLIHAI